MAVSAGKNSRVLWDEFDLTDNFTDISVSRSADTYDVTTYGKSAKNYISGLTDGTISGTAVWDDATGKVDEVIEATIGASTAPVITFSPMGDGDTIGDNATVMKAHSTSYDISSPVADVVKASIEGQVTDGAYGGDIQYLPTLTSAGEDSGGNLDGLASTSAGAIANLHCTANTWSNTTVFKIQDSATGTGAWSDLITFATVAASTVTSENATVTGTVDRYTKGVGTPAAGAGSITAVVSFARK